MRRNRSWILVTTLADLVTTAGVVERELFDPGDAVSDAPPGSLRFSTDPASSTVFGPHDDKPPAPELPSSNSYPGQLCNTSHILLYGQGPGRRLRTPTNLNKGKP
ncbi:hypothetical protein GCM10011588_60490 [Nocardia jinanensis]|uniref:Uncharacterized protein n=1 Tax=Nocardia jinanensis TaxID=382504 RepID=A0A917RVN6_9NOCA|nr:hypothetical protein GCM10011588_60490 [Nocardia jinanensis]